MDARYNKNLLKNAGALLARRAYSRNELRDKLSGLAAEAEIESVLNHLEQLNLLNDAEYAYNFALQRIHRRGWSPLKVQNALLRHNVEPQTIECALDRVRNEVSDPLILISEYVQKHCAKEGLPKDPKGIRALIAHLRRRGFDDESILGALRKLFPAAALQPFETGD